MTCDATHGTSLWLTRFSDIYFGVDTSGERTNFSTYFLLWVGGDHWLVTQWPIGFIVQFFKQSFVYVGDTFQHIYRMSMLTSSNNMRTRHVQLLKFVTVTPYFIQLNYEISNGPNLSWVYCLLDQESCVTSIELKNIVSVFLSKCVFDDLI